MSGKEFNPNHVPIYVYKRQKKTFRFGASTSNT